MNAEPSPEVLEEKAARVLDAKRESSRANDSGLRLDANDLAKKLPWQPNVTSSEWAAEQRRQLQTALTPVLRAVPRGTPKTAVSDDFHWLHDNTALLYSELHAIEEFVKPLRHIPHVFLPGGRSIPRVAAVAEGFLNAVSFKFSEPSFTSYVEGFQEITVLNVKELWALVSCLKIILLKEIAVRGAQVVADNQRLEGAGECIRSLRDIGETSWKEIIEPLIAFDRLLREDPAGAYTRMDFESRDLYRRRIVDLAEHCERSEIEIAQQALALAVESRRQGHSNPRMATRQAHIGYYFLAEGRDLLNEKVGLRPPVGQRVQSFLRRHPDEFYVPGIVVLTFAIISATLLLLTNPDSSPVLIFLGFLALLLPASQSAVQWMNHLVTSLLPAEILPKLDFSEGIPEDCLTLVAVPTLLLNEKQVRRLVADLEVRYLGNHDPNLHFVILSDLPDSRQPSREDDPLIDLCAQLIAELNEKYASQSSGSFFLLHRHRVYNPREEVWMGWERKRGKLLDLNKLLRQQYDSFPVKAGDLALLPRFRYIITLDSDTELPRGSAHRMVGALAHPLNQAIIDAENNIVTAGYGILQPRVGVSVQSAAASRLANIYSGQTGFDIYTRAISDVYQDLYGEGSFAGKGIYEVDTVHQVLDQRFPRNALLSHDLIEGAYARAGLASDIEVIEDYPSHYSAHNRRKHRWLRGDWQITAWLFSRVRDEDGRLVRNPISLVSQWKIFDNLRRSLVEPATFLLLVLGWLMLPGKAFYWTIATITILFIPTWFRFLFDLVRAVAERKSQIARDAVASVFGANFTVFLTLTFLAHQMLVSLDAMVRTLVRSKVTGRRLLEWETAAEAEIGKQKKTTVDLYMNWVPVLSAGVGLLLLWIRPRALSSALPILVLWAASKPISSWLNRPHTAVRKVASPRDNSFLRRAAIRTWRYFAEFSNQDQNWLIPDNLQENPPTIAARLSPTNLGFLLNARQVACEFGYLTVIEFAEQTLRTLATTARLPKCRGHLLNWYDTRTLKPLSPAFVSSVDSGNLVASLWTLEQGVLDMLRRPLLQPALAEGFVDHIRVLSDLRAFPRKKLNAFLDQAREDWLRSLLNFPDADLASPTTPPASKREIDADWFRSQARLRLQSLKQTVGMLMPWLLPEFDSLRGDAVINPTTELDVLAIENIVDFLEGLRVRLVESAASAPSAEKKILYEKLQRLLPQAVSNAQGLVSSLHEIAETSARMAGEMNFRFLLHPKRKLLSVGYDVDSQTLSSSCYDLLASESCIALFIAIAKDEIPQESWFLLGRAHVLQNGFPVLQSWTGTMFEYLMPALWMRTFPDTLLARSRSSAVRAQRAYTAAKNIPWGISESAYSKTDESGNYQYYAFGIPSLALRKGELGSIVISPYSSFLALTADPGAALENMRRMAHERWVGPYGFYESADFSSEKPQEFSWRLSDRNRAEIIRCWMAHHQGMSLLAIANFLHHDIVQQWFHGHPRVQATELLLHEKPVSHALPADGYSSAA